MFWRDTTEPGLLLSFMSLFGARRGVAEETEGKGAEDESGGSDQDGRFLETDKK